MGIKKDLMFDIDELLEDKNTTSSSSKNAKDDIVYTNNISDDNQLIESNNNLSHSAPILSETPSSNHIIHTNNMLTHTAYNNIPNTTLTHSNFNTVPKFIYRLYTIVSSPDHPSIQFSSSGDSILFIDKSIFITDSLPLISKTTEYSGFIRQLNAYGFKKRNRIDCIEYYHPKFKKDREDLLHLLNRKKLLNDSIPSINHNIPVTSNNIQFLTESNYHLTNEIFTLKKRLEEQENKINRLVEIMKKLVVNNDINTNTSTDINSSVKLLENNSNENDKQLDEESEYFDNFFW